MKVKYLSTVLILILAVLNIHAQEKKSIGINESIEMSIRNSKQLKLNQARIDEATASLTEATQKKLPDAGITGGYIRLSNANLNMKSQGTTPTSAPHVTQAAYGLLNAKLPIYTGGRIKYGIESSRLLAEAVKLDAEKDRGEIIVNTVEAFINLYKSKSAVDLVRENLNQAQQRVHEFSNLEKNGILARNDLLKAELQVSNTELALLEAENNWQLANVNMNLMLGLPEKTILEPDSSFLSKSFAAGTLDEYVNIALSKRKDIESSDLRKRAADVGVKSVKAEYKPSVSLSGGYVAADVPRVLVVTNAVNVGVGVSYNIASIWKTKAKVQGAEARSRQASAAQEILNDNIRLQVNNAYFNWLNSQKKIEVFVKAKEQATENYRIINNKYNNSLATTTDLLEADVAALQAKLDLLFAKADAVVAYSRLLESAGEAEQGLK